jgi:NADH dehydrogenase/NADH:ubiquinone oxidoreductase subunit G
VYELDASIRGVLALGEVLPGVEADRLRELAYVALSTHETAQVKHAKIALPIAAWAEAAGTTTNVKGLVQRMHAAFPPPGQALPAWEVVVRLASASGTKLSWTHAREVFKDMCAAVPAWKELVWAREARPLALRFAGSRG